jgi:hypothetical protein
MREDSIMVAMRIVAIAFLAAGLVLALLRPAPRAQPLRPVIPTLHLRLRLDGPHRYCLLLEFGLHPTRPSA